MYTHGDRIGLDDGQFAIDIRDGIVLCLGAAHFHGILAQVGDRSSLGGEHWLLCERIERLTILEALVFSLEWRERVALLHGVLAAADGERRFFYCQRAANVCHIEILDRARLDFDVILAHGRSRGGQAGKDGSSFQFAALDGILKGRILIAIETGDISDTHRDGIGSNDGQFAVDIRDFVVLRLGTAHKDRILAQVGDRGGLGGEHRLLDEHLAGLTVLEARKLRFQFRKRVALLHGVFAAADGERRFFDGQRTADIGDIEVLDGSSLEGNGIFAHGRSRRGLAGDDGSANEFAALNGIFERRILIAVETGDISDTHHDGIGLGDGDGAVDIRDFIVLRLGTAHHHVVGARSSRGSSLGGEHRLCGEHLAGLTVLEARKLRFQFRKRVALLHGVFAAADGERRFFDGQRAADIGDKRIFYCSSLDFDFILAHGRSRCGLA